MLETPLSLMFAELTEKMIRQLLLAMVFITTATSCEAQTNANQKMTDKTTSNNPLLCDPAEGVCGITDSNKSHNHTAIASTEKAVKLIYFTDPICSSCWGIEPQLKKLKLEYGNNIDIEYRMGGLLPDWSYNSGGISKPSDVAHHWDEVSAHYDMPIDGDVWLEDPLPSSYPPSIAFKAAEMQDKAKAIKFLREIREMVFLQKKNITKWEHLETAAQKAGLDIKRMKADYEGAAKTAFENDLKLARENGVRGFPTMFFIDKEGNKEMVYGSKPYAFFETAVLKLQPNLSKAEYRKDWESIFTKYPSLTAKEYAELTGTPRSETEATLNELTAKGKLTKMSCKNGSIWKVKS